MIHSYGQNNKLNIREKVQVAEMKVLSLRGENKLINIEAFQWTHWLYYIRSYKS